jgi:membrane protein YdbS with pleckstrin-like domain
MDPDAGLVLLEGETLLYEGRPDIKKLVSAQTIGTTLVCVLTIVLIPFLPLFLIVPWVAAQKHRFYLTDMRVVVTTGVIGFDTRSVPLERVSDVAIGCTWIDKMMGIQHVTVRDMTGEAQGGAKMLAVPDAAAVQQRVLAEVARVNKSLSSAPVQAAGGGPTLQAEAEILTLLRQIAENTSRS